MKTSLALSTLVLCALGAYVATHLKVTTDVTMLLPAGDDRDLSTLVARVADSELARSMVLTVSAPDRDLAVRASRELEAELRAEPRVQAQLDTLEGGAATGSELSNRASMKL